MTAIRTLQPILWAVGDVTYQVSACDLDVELVFQAEHEAWARSRLEGRKGSIPPAAWQADHAALLEAMNANAFAFGSSLSLRYLTSSRGMVHYVYLLCQRGAAKDGGARPKGLQAIEAIARAAGPEWDAIVSEVLQRDFPFLLSPRQATPAPSTPGFIGD